MTTPVLLVSGAGLPPWIWDAVRDAHAAPSVVAPPPDPAAGATVTDHARAALAAAPDGELVVVAHSAGGVVASEILRLAPGRVTGLLAISAVVPDPGASFVSSLPLPGRLVLPLVMRLAGTRPPESAVRKGLGAGLDERVVDRLVADLRPEARAYFTSRTGREAAALPAATAYVVTTDDAEIPLAAQRRYARRLGPGTRTHDVPGGHLPMLSHPDLVGSALAELAARAG